MKQRITYIADSGDDTDSKASIGTEKTLQVNDLQAAKEERLTVALDELPEEVFYTDCT